MVVSHAVWQNKSEPEKDTLLSKLLNIKHAYTKEQYVSSTDGTLKIPQTPLTAKKPGQRKRITNAKTVTWSRKKGSKTNDMNG